MTDSVTSEDAQSTESTKLTPISTDADLPTQVSEIIDRVEKQQGSINHIRKTVRMLRDRVTMPDGLPQGSTNPLSAKEQNEALSRYVDRTTFKNQMKQIAIKMDEISRYQKGQLTQELEVKVEEAFKQIDQAKEKIDHVMTTDNERIDIITEKIEKNVSDTSKAITQLKNGYEALKDKLKKAIKSTVDLNRSETGSVKTSLDEFKRSQIENFKKVNTTILQLKAEIEKLKKGGAVETQQSSPSESTSPPSPSADLTDIITRLDKLELNINSKNEELSLRIEEIAQEVKNGEKVTEDLSTKMSDFDNQYSLDCEQRREHDTEIDTELSKVKLSIEAAETEIKNQAENISKDFEEKISKQHIQIVEDQDKKLDEQRKDLEALIQNPSTLDSLKQDINQQLAEMKQQMASENVEQLKTDIAQQFEEQKKQIESLSNDNSKLDQLKTEINQQLEELKNKIDSTASNTQNSEIDEIKKQIENLIKESEKQTTQITSITNTTTTIENVKNEINSRIDQQTTQITNTFNQFKTEISEKVQQIENTANTLNAKPDLEGQLNEQKTQIDTLTKDKTKLEMLNKVITGQINDIKNEIKAKDKEVSQKFDLLTTQISENKGSGGNDITSDAVMMLQDQISALRRDVEKHKETSDEFIKQTKNDMINMNSVLAQKVDLNQSEQIHGLFESQIHQLKEDFTKQLDSLKDSMKSSSSAQIDSKEFDQLKEKVDGLGTSEQKHKEIEEKLKEIRNECENQVNQLKSIYESSVTEIKSIYKQSITDIKTTTISKIEIEMEKLSTQINEINSSLEKQKEQENTPQPQVTERSIVLDENSPQLTEIQSQIEELKKSHDQILNDVQLLKEKSESSEKNNTDTIQSLKETINTINTKVETVTQITEKITQIEKETNTVQSLQETVNTLNSRVEQINQLNEKITQIEKETNTIQSLTETVNTINSKVEQINQLSEKISTFEKETSTIQSVTEIVNTLKEKVEQINQLNEKVLQIEKETNTIQSYSEQINTINSKLEQINQLNEKVLQIEKETNTIQSLTETVNTINSKVEQISQLNEKISSFEKETNTIQSLTETVNTLKEKVEQINQLNEKISSFEKEKSTIQSLSEKLSQIEKDTTTIQSLNETVNTLNEKVSQIEKDTSTIQTLTNTINEMTTKIDQLSQQNIQTRSITIEEETETSDKVLQLSKDLQLLQEKVDTMSKNEEQLTSQLSEFKDEYNKNVNSTAEIIGDTVKSFKTAHDGTVSEIQEIKDKVSDVVNQMTSSTLERVQKLEDSFKSVSETSNKFASDFEELKNKMYTTFVTADALDTIKQKRKNLKENVKTMVTELNGYIETERNERNKSIDELKQSIEAINQSVKESSEKAENEAKLNKEQIRKILKQINRISKAGPATEDGGEGQSQGASPELQMDVDELKFKLNQLEEINNKYKDDISELNKTIQDFNNKMKEQKDDYTNRISNLEYVSNSEQKDIMDKISKLEDQFDSTTKSLSDLPSMVMNSNQMNQAAINEFSQHVEDTLTDMKSQLKQATFADDDITELTNKFNAFEELSNKKHSELSDKIEKVEFELSQRRAAEIEHSKLWAAINDNKVKIDVQLEKTNPQFSSLISKLKKSIKELEKANEVDDSELESATLPEDSSPTPEYTAVIETLKAKVSNLEEENRKVGNSVSHLQEEVSVSRDNIDRIAKQIREEVVEMRNKLPESFIEIDAFNGLKEEVNVIHGALNTAIETTVSEREKVEEQLSEFNNSMTSLQSTVKNEVQTALQNALKDSNISTKDIHLDSAAKSDEDDDESKHTPTAIIGADDESANKLNSNEVGDLKLMINGIDIALQRQIRKLKISVRNIERMLEDAAEEEKRQQELEKQKKEKEELAKEIVEEEKKKREEEMIEEEEEIDDDEVIQLNPQNQKDVQVVQQGALQVAQPGAVVYVAGDQNNNNNHLANQQAIITTVKLPTAIELIQDDFNIFFVLMFSVLLYFLVSDLFLS